MNKEIKEIVEEILNAKEIKDLSQNAKLTLEVNEHDHIEDLQKEALTRFYLDKDEAVLPELGYMELLPEAEFLLEEFKSCRKTAEEVAGMIVESVSGKSSEDFEMEDLDFDFYVYNRKDVLESLEYQAALVEAEIEDAEEAKKILEENGFTVKIDEHDTSLHAKDPVYGDFDIDGNTLGVYQYHGREFETMVDATEYYLEDLL